MLVLLLALPGGLHGLSAPAGTASLDASTDEWRLDEHYRKYELQTMDPYAFRDMAAEGEVEITLLGRSFRFAVECRDPCGEDMRIGTLHANGTVTYEDVEFDPLTYSGHALDDSGASVFFVITSSGVGGHVRAVGVNIEFSPVRFIDGDAPPGLTVVYHVNDAIYHPYPAHSTPTFEPDLPNETLEEPK